MNKKNLRAAGWALCLAMAVAGIGAAVGASFAQGGDAAVAHAATSNTVTFAQTSTSAASQSGTYPAGATVSFATTYTTKEQLTSGNSQTWTFKGYSGKKITGISADLKRNASKGTGTASITNNGSEVTVVKSSYGRADLTNSYKTYQIAKSDFVCDGDIVLTFAATENSFYCNQVVLTWEENVTYVANSLTLSPESSLTLDGKDAVTKKDGTITYSVGYAGDKGDGLVDVSITKAGEATTGLTYSDNGSGTITLTGKEEGDYVVTVATKDNDESGHPISHDIAVSVQNLLEPVIPEKTTSVDNLSIGDIVYFVNETATTAAGAISGSYLSSQTVTIAANKITDVGSAIGFKLGRDGANYTFKTEGEYLAADAAKSLNTSSVGTNTWVISFDAGNAVIDSTDLENLGTLYYNSSSPRFLNYSTSVQAAVQLYVASATDAEVAAEFEKEYLVMDKDVPGQCYTYYANAKTTFATLTTEQRALLSTEALTRLKDWAAANGETFKASDGSFTKNTAKNVFFDENGKTGAIVSLAAVAGIGLIATGVLFLLRKKKEEK